MYGLHRLKPCNSNPSAKTFTWSFSRNRGPRKWERKSMWLQSFLLRSSLRCSSLFCSLIHFSSTFPSLSKAFSKALSLPTNRGLSAETQPRGMEGTTDRCRSLGRLRLWAELTAWWVPNGWWMISNSSPKRKKNNGRPTPTKLVGPGCKTMPDEVYT